MVSYYNVLTSTCSDLALEDAFTIVSTVEGECPHGYQVHGSEGSETLLGQASVSPWGTRTEWTRFWGLLS